MCVYLRQELCGEMPGKGIYTHDRGGYREEDSRRMDLLGQVMTHELGLTTLDN